MKKIVLGLLLVLLCFEGAFAHRTEVNILDTEAGKAAALAKVGGETGRYVNKQKGLDILNQALIEVFNVKDNHYREMVLAAIANEYAGLDEINRAINITRGLKDVHLYVTNLGKIANKLVKSDPLLGEELLNEGISKAKAEAEEDDLPALLAELSGKYMRLNKVTIAKNLLQEAIESVEKIKEIHLDDKLSLYAEIAANMVAAGQKEEAFKLFDKAYELSSQLVDPFEKAAILAMLGGELAEKGQPEKALLMLEQALKVSAEIKDDQKRNDITSEIARNFSQSKNCQKGAEIANSISDAYFSAEALITTAKNYNKVKQNESALVLLQQLTLNADNITSANKRAVVLAKTAAEFAEQGKINEAEGLLTKAYEAII